MSKVFYTIGLLVLSNTFMMLAWYGHLKFREISWLSGLSIVGVIFVSWGIAFFEYLFMIPANRLGFRDHGGPFSLVELKVLQEVITLSVFLVFTLVLFKTETFKWNHFVGFGFLILAVYFIFRK